MKIIIEGTPEEIAEALERLRGEKPQPPRVTIDPIRVTPPIPARPWTPPRSPVTYPPSPHPDLSPRFWWEIICATPQDAPDVVPWNGPLDAGGRPCSAMSSNVSPGPFAAGCGAVS